MKTQAAHEGDRPFGMDVPKGNPTDVNMGHQKMTAPVIVLGGHNNGNGGDKKTQQVNK